jgi:branched-chain amino acid transport system substrate-binding protein
MCRAGPRPIFPQPCSRRCNSSCRSRPRPRWRSRPSRCRPAPPLTAPGSADAIRIGFLAPLSGPNAGLGRALFDAAQLALFDLADNRLVLLPRDTEGNAEKASEAARRVIAEGAQIIIGAAVCQRSRGRGTGRA